MSETAPNYIVVQLLSSVQKPEIRYGMIPYRRPLPELVFIGGLLYRFHIDTSEGPQYVLFPRCAEGEGPFSSIEMARQSGEQTWGSRAAR